MKKQLLPLIFSVFFSTTCSVMAMDMDTQDGLVTTCPKVLPKYMTELGLNALSETNYDLASTLNKTFREAYNHAVDNHTSETAEMLEQNFFIRFKTLRDMKSSTYGVFLNNQGIFEDQLLDKTNIQWNYNLAQDSEKENLDRCYKIITETGINRDYRISQDENLTKLFAVSGITLGYGNPLTDRWVFNVAYAETEGAPLVVKKDFYFVQASSASAIKDFVKELNSKENSTN